MQFIDIQQRTPEWFSLKAGMIGGTRFGQVISNRDNSLIYHLINETLNGTYDGEDEDYVSDEMQYGNDNEEFAIEKYEAATGIPFIRGGVILSDYSKIQMCSPDAHNEEKGIILEVKCTMEGATQIKRFFEGVEKSKLPQIINYFACSDDVKEVHLVSFCSFRPERELITKIFKREEFFNEIELGRLRIGMIEKQIPEMIEQFMF